MTIILFILIAIVFISVIVGYLIFLSTLDRDFKLPESKNKDENDEGLMAPTGKELIEFTIPLIKKFNSLPFEELCTESFDNHKLYAYLLDRNPKEVVICMHGYRSRKDLDFCDKYEIYEKRNSTCLFLTARAHEKSEGKYIGFSELDRFDIARWVDVINERYDNPRIYLHGVSMGGASVIHCADMNLKNVCGIIDDCGFTSAEGITRALTKDVYGLPYFPFAFTATLFAKLIAKVDFKRSEGEICVANTNTPIIFIHGTSDIFVPSWMSEKMYKACRSPKRLLLVEDAGHAAAYMKAKDRYTELVNELLNQKIH